MMTCGAGDTCPLDSARPDAAAPDHDHGLPGLDLGPVHRRAVPGGDPAADERRRFHVGVRLDTDQRVLVAHHFVGEGPELAHPVHVRSVQVVAVRPVADHAAGQRRHPEVAQILATRSAPVARPTGRDERHRHVIAQPDLRHVGPDLGHDARSFVSADDREHGGCADQFEHFGRSADITAAQMLVGVAHAGVHHLHPDLAVARRVYVDLFGLPWLVQSGTDHRTRLIAHLFARQLRRCRVVSIVRCRAPDNRDVPPMSTVVNRHRFADVGGWWPDAAGPAD